jgi:VIT1/CCC1 family predicted Fe2+/Mn2+ transporter
VPHLLRESRAGALDPVDRASEVIFGLLMAMTFVGTIGVAEGGRDELRTLLIAAFGCNLAWGIADAVMYLVGVAVEARRHRALLARLHSGLDAAAGRRVIADSLPPGLASVLAADDLETLRRRLVAVPLPAGVPRLGIEHYRAALAVFVLVVLATFPVVLPYLLIDDVVRALRVSQAVALVTLFVAGATLARHSGGSVWRTGLAMTAVGALLLAVLVLLGG